VNYPPEAECRYGDACAVVNDILNNSLFHSRIRINGCIKSFTSCTFVLWTRCWIMPQILKSVGLRSGLFSGHKSGSLQESPWDYCIFGVEAANDAQTVWVNTACGKENSQKNLPKPTLWYRNVYNQIASDVRETDKTCS